jgi:3-oxoacyl-[acyl-carrier protein] reductase
MAVGDDIRTVLVTGGTGGMGRVIAAKLAADGSDVAVAYAGSVDLADATVKEITGHRRRRAAFAADVADEDAMSAVLDAVQDRFGAGVWSQRRRPGPMISPSGGSRLRC